MILRKRENNEKTGSEPESDVPASEVPVSVSEVNSAAQRRNKNMQFSLVRPHSNIIPPDLGGSSNPGPDPAALSRPGRFFTPKPGRTARFKVFSHVSPSHIRFNGKWNSAINNTLTISITLTRYVSNQMLCVTRVGRTPNPAARPGPWASRPQKFSKVIIRDC